MKTLLLDKTGNVYKIVGECTFKGDLIYTGKLGKWCSLKGDYLFEDFCGYGGSDAQFIHEDDVEIIDTNTVVIVNAKSVMMGFELAYIEDFDYE